MRPQKQSLCHPMNQSFISLRPLLFLITTAFARAPTSFTETKAVAKRQVLFDQADGAVGDLYCGCNWTSVGKSGGRVDAKSCGYESENSPRAPRAPSGNTSSLPGRSGINANAGSRAAERTASLTTRSSRRAALIPVRSTAAYRGLVIGLFVRLHGCCAD